MGHLVDEYKRKKAMEGKPSTMYIVHSTREGVTITTTEILSILEDQPSRISYYKDNKWVDDTTRYNHYKILPFPGDVKLDMTNPKAIDKHDGYASGWGDLWCWSYFSTLDEETAQAKYKEETERVYQKYLDPNRPPEPPILMPSAQ